MALTKIADACALEWFCRKTVHPHYPSNESNSDVSQAPDSCPPSFALAFWDQPKSCQRSLDFYLSAAEHRSWAIEPKRRCQPALQCSSGSRCGLCGHQTISNSAESSTLRCRSGQIFPDGPIKHVSWASLCSKGTCWSFWLKLTSWYIIDNKEWYRPTYDVWITGMMHRCVQTRLPFSGSTQCHVMPSHNEPKLEAWSNKPRP